MEAVSACKGGPNRLLWFFLAVSAAVHLLLILYGDSPFRPEARIPIELTVQPSAPPKRAIPKTPIRPQLPDAHGPIPRSTARPAPAAPAAPVKADPVESPLPQKPAKEVFALKPESLDIPGLKVSKWVPPQNLQPNDSKSAAAPALFAGPAALESPAAPALEAGPAVKEHYLSTIRGLIERQKKYPKAARLRQFQGKVVVEFLLAPTGDVNSIRVVEECRFSILNRAAIQAVEDASPFPKPPDGLFSGNLSLRIPIVFELI
ncbi:MAG: energy transducer TonB [Desulfobacteraceae bacterium]|nr:MAG: energy transducer TonB [Desulfobacteraceae bacterium]